MKNLFYCTALIVAAVTLTNGQISKFGDCPKVKLAENFEPAKYFSGKFYEQKRFWTIFEIGSKCVNAEYKAVDDGTVQVNNSGFSLKKNNRFFQIGEAYCEKDTKSACHVRFYPGTPYGNYNLIAADPNKYGLVFSCRQVIPGFVNTQYAWILTRDRIVSKTDMDSYLEMFRKNGIDVTKFIDTPQDCLDK